MKEGIHPEYHTATVQCACGNTFLTGTTKKTDVIKVEICSKCHPYFTGKQKLVDTGGRVDKFKKRYNLDRRQVQEEIQSRLTRRRCRLTRSAFSLLRA